MSRMNSLVSVIMPVYNIGGIKSSFIHAVQSVLNQSLIDFELLIVNDGSNDNTKDILQTLIKKDARIQVLNKENGGVESARRFGLRKAKGEFVIHMDQDDLYAPNALDVFVSKITENNADVAIANSKRFIIDKKFGRESVPLSMRTERIIEHQEFMDKYYISFFGISDIPVNIWNKMYRRAFIQNIPEPPLTGQIIEDLSYNMHVLPYADKICIIPDVLYYYRWGGFTSRYDKTILDTALVGYRYKMALIETYNLSHRFTSTTSIELLNYLNTYFYQEALYNHQNLDRLLQTIRNTFRVPEVECAVMEVRDRTTYRNRHVEYMIQAEFEALAEYEACQAKRQRFKKALKKIFSKLLN